MKRDLFTLGLGFADELIVDDPAERMSLPTVKNERQVYLDRPHFLAVIRHMKPGSARATVRIAFHSGMRANEAQLATFHGDMFLLPPEVTKNGQPRNVPAHPKLLHIARTPGLWPIQPTRWTVSTKFGWAAVAAGFGHARLNDVRHSAASAMTNAGIDLYTVGGVLGHKSPFSTRRYSHLAAETLANAICTIGKNRRTLSKKKAA